MLTVDRQSDSSVAFNLLREKKIRHLFHMDRRISCVASSLNKMLAL